MALLHPNKLLDSQPRMLPLWNSRLGINVVMVARMITSDLSAFVTEDCFSEEEPTALKKDFSDEVKKEK